LGGRREHPQVADKASRRSILRQRRPIAAASTAATLRLPAILLALAVLAGCSDMALPKDNPAPAAPDPSYGKIVADRLKSTFKALPPTAAVEISQPRRTHTVTGSNWVTCVHFQDQGRRRTYALFLNGSAIVDARYAVQTDGCDSVSYSALDLASGAVTSATSGEQGPIY
jgi:hypothetical protein